MTRLPDGGLEAVRDRGTPVRPQDLTQRRRRGPRLQTNRVYAQRYQRNTSEGLLPSSGRLSNAMATVM